MTKKEILRIIREELSEAAEVRQKALKTLREAHLNESYVSTDWDASGREAGATANMSKKIVTIDDGREFAINMPFKNFLELADKIESAMGGRENADTEAYDL